MLFIGFAIVIAIGLALLISADAGSLIGLSQDQTGHMIPLVIILTLVASSLFARRQRASDMIGNVVLWIGIFGVALVGYTYRDDLTQVAYRVMGELVPGVPQVDGERGTALFRAGRDGHFTVNATIDGTEIRTIFDTGASAVVLTDADARAVGIDPDTLSYNVRVSTANGTGRAASVTLARLEVGGIVRNRVRAFVAEPEALETSLLGMTFLSTLSRYAVSGNSLELVD